MSLAEKLKFRKFIKQLKRYKGRHTELISVYLPPKTEISKTIQTLSDEQGTATNIKDKNTGKSVITSLERMIRTLKTFDRVPDNGIAIFSGNVSDRDNISDFKVFWVEPPKPVSTKLYRCEQRFITKHLEEMDANETTYGLIVIDKGEATVGVLCGSSIRTIKTMVSNVPGKHKTGGQSAQRFERIREGATIEFFKRVSDVVTKEFTYMNELKGILIGGPGTTKNNFVDGNYMNEQIKGKIIAVKDITYTNAFGLKELFDASENDLADTEVVEERKTIEKFFDTLGKNVDMVVYGLENTKAALKMGAVDSLIIIDDIVSDEDLEELTKIAQISKTNVSLVTDKTPEGVQYKGLTGIGGILRYPISN